MAGTVALINSAVSLALEVGSTLIPVIKGAITSIKSDLTPQGTVQYTVVITADQAELTDTVNISIADLVAINKELAAQNAPQQPVPPAA